MSYDPNNIFARILRGDAPCIKVFEDATTLAFMDVMPQSDGHLLVVPKEDAAEIFELSEAAAVACIRTVRRLSIAVRAALQPTGVVVAQFNGSDAGQTVPHVHFHIIPRWAHAPLIPHARIQADRGRLEELASLIRSKLVDDSLA
ncbi:HIT family protein [Pararobbsia silviterrae]|uniref:HIT family protein n=1 Tax=Pararobbsia silviterrae TaxID=1792498 RepID=A0A494XFW5_9BURK|nr:HIT family protein [Pararobbsia silviterrae]RKP47049.1 HIT family protein [Pararobbsia silviterrae]